MQQAEERHVEIDDQWTKVAKNLNMNPKEKVQEREERLEAEDTMLPKLVQLVVVAKCGVMDPSHAVDVRDDRSDATMTCLRAKEKLQNRVRVRVRA